MKSNRSLRRQLRALWVTNLVLFAAVCIAATPAVRPLLLDTSNHPTTNVDFASSHWTGDPTSGKAIAPASVTTATLGAPASANSVLTLSANGASLALGFSGNAAGNALTIHTPTLFGANAGLATFGGSLSIGTWSANQNALRFGVVRVIEPSAGTLEFNRGTPLDYGGTAADLVCGSLTANAPISFDDGGGFSDGVGDLYAQNLISGSLTTFSGATNLSDDGLFVNNFYIADSLGQMYAGGYLIADGNGNLLGQGFGLFGVTPVTAKPAAPTTLPQVISTLHAYGFW